MIVKCLSCGQEVPFGKTVDSVKYPLCFGCYVDRWFGDIKAFEEWAEKKLKKWLPS